MAGSSSSINSPEPSVSEENPLIAACRQGNRYEAENLARTNRDHLRARDNNGQTPLHIACSNGNLDLVQLFISLEPELCQIEDHSSFIPLHIAVELGFADIITALVRAHPQCIEAVTSHGETVFHLAAKHQQPDAFEVLLQLAPRDQNRLLHLKNQQGDSVLHIAASNKLAGVIERLLSARDPALVRVNTMNRDRLTALDVYYGGNLDRATRDIGDLLREAGGLEARSLAMSARIGLTLETNTVTLAALSVIAGAAFTTVCNLPPSFLVKADTHKAGLEFGVHDVMTAQLPSVFYLMVFNSSVLMVCLAAILVLLWSLPVRPVLVFLTIAIGIVYAILVDNIMPRLLVRVGDGSFQGSILVGLLALGFICLGAVMYCCVSLGYKVFRWLISETTQKFEHLL